MIDHIVGKPSSSWRRTQVFLVIIFWLFRIVRGDRSGPSIPLVRRWNRSLSRFTPWQLIVSTLTAVYALRNIDNILGLAAPEPLARLYSRSYYRATWIATGFDAGFATAMNIKAKWLRDLCSVLFSLYYIVYAHEADEKLRKFRAVCTVEMLRVTWEKTSNPYIRAATYFDRPRLRTVRQLLLPRPKDSSYTRPIAAWLFFAGAEHQLSEQTDLILDLPGGGFICMGPQHHEERLRRWAKITGRPVLSIDYSKAPEYPFPYALDECFDTYRVIAESAGRLLGMNGSRLNVILTGDSAGAYFCVTTMIKILEHPTPVPPPTALVLNYSALDFNFTSWMTPANMRVLRREQSNLQGQAEQSQPSTIPQTRSRLQLNRSRNAGLAAIAEQKDHYAHRSPLSAVRDVRVKKRKSWTSSLGGMAPFTSDSTSKGTRIRARAKTVATAGDDGHIADDDGEAELDPTYRPISDYVRYHDAGPSSSHVAHDPLGDVHQAELAAVREQQSEAPRKRAAIGTRLAMTSRTGYFQDRIISPGMMRAMAILYVGPSHNPDLATDYYLSPILAPDALLARFPRMLMTCGEKDPFVDDTVVFCGRVREAKRVRRAQLQQQDPATLTEEERVLLAESDDDWVQLEILEGWSHGYMQMTAILPDAVATIARIGEWIGEVFDLLPEPQPEPRSQQPRGIPVAAASPRPRAGPLSGSAPAARVPDLGAPVAISSETETSEVEEADLLMMVPKKRRSPPPGSSFATRRLSSSSGGTAIARERPLSDSFSSSPAERPGASYWHSRRDSSGSASTAIGSWNGQGSYIGSQRESFAERRYSANAATRPDFSLSSRRTSSRSPPRGVPTFMSSPKVRPISPSSDETLAPATPPHALAKAALDVPAVADVAKAQGKTRAGQLASAGTRTATPNGTKTALLAEASLMRRRMDDVVHGLGGEEDA